MQDGGLRGLSGGQGLLRRNRSTKWSTKSGDAKNHWADCFYKNLHSIGHTIAIFCDNIIIIIIIILIIIVMGAKSGIVGDICCVSEPLGQSE